MNCGIAGHSEFSVAAFEFRPTNRDDNGVYWTLMPTGRKVNATEDRPTYCTAVVEWMCSMVGANDLGDITRRRAAAAADPLVLPCGGVHQRIKTRDKTRLTGAEQPRVRTASVLSHRGVALLMPKLRQQTTARSKSQIASQVRANALAVSAPQIRYLLRKFD